MLACLAGVVGLFVDWFNKGLHLKIQMKTLVG